MRREHSSVIGDLLHAIARWEGREPRLTRIAAEVNVPHDRLQRYLADLRSRGVLEEAEALRLTPLGRALLANYRSWERAQEEAGLRERGDPR